MNMNRAVPGHRVGQLCESWHEGFCERDLWRQLLQKAAFDRAWSTEADSAIGSSSRVRFVEVLFSPFVRSPE